jgi:CubicO group peptidase (beta-lactamase class C family)
MDLEHWRLAHPQKGPLLFGLLLGTALGLLAASARAEGPVADLPAAKAEAIEAAITATMTKAGIPGASVAIAVGGRLRFAQGYGHADLENGVPAKASTMYRLASVAKPITAVAVLKLAEEGRLDLDAPIQRMAPAFAEKAWPVTARQLLGHLGGVRHYRDDEPTNTTPCASMECSLAFFKGDPLVVEPGTRFVYSTYGYSLLGAAVEGAAGRSYLEYLRQAVFDPAGMASIRPDEVRPLIPNRAQGYVRTEAGQVLNSDLADVSYKVPGGGLIATASDVARFGAALQAGSLVSRESLQAMLTPQRETAGRATGYGLGLNVATNGGRREAWHTGGQERVSTVVFLLPDEGASVAVLTNLEGVGRELVALGRRLAEVAVAPETAAAAAPKR